MFARQSQLTGRDRLARLMAESGERAAHLSETGRMFAELSGNTAAPRVVSAYQLFQTPEDIAAKMVEMLPEDRGAILEPSAGLGRIYRAIRKRFPRRPVTMVDVAPQCVEELRGETSSDVESEVFCRDFLELTPEQLGTFSAIVMNPPFHNRSDIKHIKHAIEFLAPGGILISVCMGGEIRARELGKIGSLSPLPPKSFRSEGTNVDTSIFVYRK